MSLFLLTRTRSSLLLLTSRPLFSRNSSTMAPSKPATTTIKPKPGAPAIPRPSSSVILLSPTNQVLLLKRVQTSSSFASAHVFPGGNLDPKHDGEIADPSQYHRDGLPYRMAAIRETFEETGILLAFDKAGNLLKADDEARREVHSGKKKFLGLVDELGGKVDLDGLIPFTRWVTPPNMKKRFTTQMYIYLMPLSVKGRIQERAVVPTHDGGLEHTELAFDAISNWLEKAKQGKVVLYPPQFYILSVLEPFFSRNKKNDVEEQRKEFLEFVKRVPTAEGGKETEMIAWEEKVMSPTVVGRKEDGRLIMGLDKPGPELEGTDGGRGGDGWRRIVVRFGKEGPSEVSVEVGGEGREKGKL